jgi:hypothetical protein
MKKLYFLYYFLIFNFFLINYVVGQDVLFKVTRIKSKGDYFIIIAERNDSLFKIISKKVSLINPNLELLKKDITILLPLVILI